MAVSVAQDRYLQTPKAGMTRCFLTAASLALALPAGAALMAAPAFATEAAEKEKGPQSGTLMLRKADGESAVAAIRLGTDMSVDVSGNIARVQVTQVFRNVSEDWVEATYLYPLPEDAAVDSLKMTVGNRVIIGKIKKRKEAREIYEAAKAEGKKAGLVEQQRPNMFTNSVANVGPGETVMVVIEYQMPLKQLDGNFALRLPLVVGPRYVPPHSITSKAALDDAQTITAAPVKDPKTGKVNPVSINVNLNPGFVPANIESRYHAVSVSGKDAQRKVTLAKGTVPQDRDFELNWRSASATPTLALFREERAGNHYVMASITPPVDDKKRAIPPREMIFVIDNSGSMMGESMDAAKASLLHALDTLRPTDRFNIIRFDDTMTMLFREAIDADSDSITKAKAFTRKLEANGGTEMLPALRAALKEGPHSVAEQAANAAADMQVYPDRVRQIIFLTDGSLSNEREMMEEVSRNLRRSRLFMVGIGSAPNNYLMSRMARSGRGIYTNIGKPKEVKSRMAKLLDMLSRPAMQDLKVSVGGGSFDLTPRMLPDLYSGEPLVLLGRSDELKGTITVSGKMAGKTWSQSVDLTKAVTSPSVAKLWARRRIEEVEADLILGKLDYETADAAITELGLDFHIVTRMTSLVAVDETPSRPAGTPLREVDLPINLPAGWDFDHLFGGETAKAALANEARLAQMKAQEERKKFQLPQTATNYQAKLLIGLLAMLLGLFGFIATRGKKEI